ncbi:MAG TPA: hypothetical protein VK427_24750 [Kofleriaceae bacterium]|nr:hypothetical protein [Kofleriaceae bacterium]
MIEKLDEALTYAFPPVTIDRLMIEEPTANWSVYDERGDLVGFEGKTWPELPAALLKRHPTLPIYAGDALFCATLPAFLRYLLHERESFNDLPFQLAGQLTRRTDVDNKKLDRRLSRLTTAQRAAVGEMLAYLAEVAPMDEIMGGALATWNKEGEGHGGL